MRQPAAVTPLTLSLVSTNIGSVSQKEINFLTIASRASPDEINVLGVAHFDGRGL